MGGKSYFCDYCRCYMKNDRNVRKTHNEGLQHKIIKTSYMKIFDDPRKLYEEEIIKQPCSRYFKNFCKYDLYCQYTHFNEIQLQQLKEMANANNKKSNLKQSKAASTTLPWKNSITKRNLKLLPSKLPPSLRELSLSKLPKFDTINKWG